jgi:ABC-type phosphate transport system substrate-binding protein
MRPRVLASAACLAAWLIFPVALGATDPRVRVIAHPTRATKLSASEVRAIYFKRQMLWSDGRPIIPINREAGSVARELFSKRLFGQDSLRLATYWNQRYFEAGEFPPATLASEEAVVRFVAGNENAIGYVTREEVGDSVAVVLVLE